MNCHRQNAKKMFLARLAIAASVALLMLPGCPTGSDPNHPPPGPRPDLPSALALPERPVIVAMQDGYGFTEDVDLGNAAAINAAVNDPGKKKPVISLAWTGANTQYYNLYWSDEAMRPAIPQAENIKDTVYFIREGLLPETQYYVWVEAINANGVNISDRRGRATRSAGIERGDYPRNMRIEPGNGTLTVWWDLADRVGWHEIYFAPVGAINRIDANTPMRFKWYEPPFAGNTAYKNKSNAGWTHAIYPMDSPMGISMHGSHSGYRIGKNSGTSSCTRAVMGIKDFGKTDSDPDWNPTYAAYPPPGAFPFIFEAWLEGDGDNDLGRLVPYQPLHENFAAALPWDEANGRAGIPGAPIRHYGNHVTITGLENGTQYEVWVRVPNVNGERGYGYIVGTPGASGLPAPQNIKVTVPEGATRDLDISWDEVSGATAYRLYLSQSNDTPGPRTPFDRIASTGETACSVSRAGLLPNAEYFVWVVAELNRVAGEIGASARGKTGSPPLAGVMRKKLDVNGNPVKTLVYVEVNAHNPLNAGSYILESGAFLFDYVVIFAANLRNRNCAHESDPHGCARSGVHLHLNENVRHVLENRAVYIEPLQEKGIKVLLGLLGDWDGIGFGSMTEAEIATFIESVRQDVELYQLDGIDFCDEWSSKMLWEDWPNASTPSPQAVAVYPFYSFGSPFPVRAYRKPNMGIVPGNIRTLTSQLEREQLAPALDQMWLQGGRTLYQTISEARRAMPETVITLYESNNGRWVTPCMAPTNEGLAGPGALGSDGPSVKVTRELLASLVDFALQPWYNQWHDDSANGLPRSMFSPLAIDVGGHAYGGQNSSPNPTFPGEEAGACPISISTVAERFLNASNNGNPYGVMFFYGLNPSSQLLRLNPNAPADKTKEEYLSHLTVPVFNQRVLLTAEGGNYLKDW